MELKHIIFISILLLLTAGCASAYTISYTNMSSNVINFGTTIDASTIDTITLNNTISCINFFQANDVPGTVRIQDTANISLLDTAKRNSSNTFQARDMYSLGLFSVNTRANSLVNEFEVSNIAKNNTPGTIVSGTSTSGFFSYVGNNTTFAISNKRVNASGTTNSNGVFYVRKYVSLDLSKKQYISFNINCSQSGLLYFSIASSLGNSKVWNTARFPVTANEVTHFVLPIQAPAGTSGENPSSTPGTIVMSSVANVYIGMTGAQPNSNVSIYVDNIASDNGRPAYIELQTPDSLSSTSVNIESWTGTAYETFATYGADSSYNSVSTDTTKLRSLDGTKWDDVFGAGGGRAFYPKGISGDTVLGSDNTTITYQNTKGSIKKIGLRFDLPPSDSRTDFNKARFRVTTYYTSPAVTYNLNSTTPITLTYLDDNNLLYNSANNPNVVAPMSFNLPSKSASQWNNSVVSNPITLIFDSSTDINEIDVNLPTQISVNGIICNNTSVLYSPEVIFSTLNQTWTTGWQHCASVTVDNNAQNIRDYQIHETIQGNDPTASNYVDFSKTTGEDLRVTNSDGITKLPYWIESWDNVSKTGSIWVKVPSIPISQAPQYFKFSTTPTLHNYYGLSYPVTYEFNIPARSSSLKAYKKFNLDDSWTQITEKESTDFFNGIEAVRFDYINNKAYVSVAFDANSNDIYLEIVDSNNNQVGTYQQIDKYYDNRKAAVVITADDWWEGSDSNFTSFSNLCAQDELWFSVGIITNTIDAPVNWTSVQNAINNGYIEPCSHSRTHRSKAYADYDSEIGGSKTDIINNLSLPDLNKMGSQEYIYSWIEPGGYTDSTVTEKLGEYKYLCDRSTNSGLNNFYSTWDSTNGVYYKFGPSIEADDHNISSWAPPFPGTSRLNDEFDKVVTHDGIYTLYLHPNSVTTTELSPHFDYIKQRNNIWYVGEGHLYLYDFIHRQASKEIPQSGYTLYIYYGNSTASSLSNFSSVFTKDYGESGLVGLWHMDEGSGITITDSSGNGNSGTIAGATWSANDGGQWGNRKDITFSKGSSLQFNGVNNSVNCGNKPSLQVSKTFTIAAWVNYQGTSSSKSWNSIVDKGKVESTAPYNGFYLGYKPNINSWQFKVANGIVASDTIYYKQPYSEVYNKNHYVTATFDNGMMKLYIDGILVSSKVSAITDVSATLNNLKIGMSSTYNQNWFNGNIDEVRIYNRVLTDEEIVSYYLRSKYVYPLPQCG